MFGYAWRVYTCISQSILILTCEESYCGGEQGILGGFYTSKLSLASAFYSKEENWELQVETFCISAEQSAFQSWQGSDKLKVKVGNLCFQVSSIFI